MCVENHPPFATTDLSLYVPHRDMESERDEVVVVSKGQDGAFKVTLTGTFVYGEVKCTASFLLHHELGSIRALSLCPQ